MLLRMAAIRNAAPPRRRRLTKTTTTTTSRTGKTRAGFTHDADPDEQTGNQPANSPYPATVFRRWILNHFVPTQRRDWPYTPVASNIHDTSHSATSPVPSWVETQRAAPAKPAIDDSGWRPPLASASPLARNTPNNRRLRRDPATVAESCTRQRFFALPRKFAPLCCDVR